MLNAETIIEIERLVKATQEIKQLNSLEYGYFDAAGDFQTAAYTLEPLKAANLRVFSLSSLQKLLKDNNLESSLRKYILLSSNKVIAIEESATERRTYTLELPQHPVWKLLNHHLETRTYSQRDLLRMLRSKLADLVPPVVLAAVQTIKVKTEGGSSSDLTNGKNHVSRELLQQVQAQNGTALPESVTITAPVYDLPETLEVKPAVKLLLETEVDEAVRFSLTTVHNDVTTAQEIALEGITAILGQDFPVYRAAI